MQIEFKTDLLLVKHTGALEPESPNCSYEMWMIPCTPGAVKEHLHTFEGPREAQRIELEKTLAAVLEGFRQDGVTIPVLQISSEDELYITEESERMGFIARINQRFDRVSRVNRFLVFLAIMVPTWSLLLWDPYGPLAWVVVWFALISTRVWYLYLRKGTSS